MLQFSCANLEELEPVQKDSFVKYFGNQGNNVAVDLEVLDDGYLILATNENGVDKSTILFKTDLLGNTLWAEKYADITGNDLEATPNGYFFIGDSIKTNNLSTSMSLIKTDLLGKMVNNVVAEATNSSYHGTAVTFSSKQEVVIQGYAEYAGGDTTFTMGYTANLDPAWQQMRKLAALNTEQVTSRSIYEVDETGEGFMYLSTIDPAELSPDLAHVAVDADATQPVAGGLLFSNRNLASTEGDFIPSSQGFTAVKTLNTGGGSSIGLSHFTIMGELQNYSIGTDGFNYFAHSVSRTNDGELIILGSKGTTIDTDFYIIKVGYDGLIHSEFGFENTIGGIGRETGAAIKQAGDGGYIFTGTLENVNDTKLIVLIKVNGKGELKN
jgi:hypothetical protein